MIHGASQVEIQQIGAKLMEGGAIIQNLSQRIAGSIQQIHHAH